VDLSWQLQRISWTHGCTGPDTVNAKGKTVKACGFKNAASCPTRKIICPPDWEYRQLTNGMLLSRPKSSAGTRIVPLVEPLLSIVERRLVAVSREPNPHALVWTADPKKDRHGRLQPLDGAPVDPSWDNEHWHAVLERAGVPQARLHAARHTTASLLRKAKVSTETITRILGHSSSAMSEKYIDYEVEQLFAAMTDGSTLLALPQLEGQPQP
jgi:integrase